MRTFLPKTEEIDRKWYVVDASGKVLGRLASEIAAVLMGKRKPIYTDFMDTGDYVIVINAHKVRLTGGKWDEKVYYSHSGRPGALKQITAREMRKKFPERLIYKAVRGMLPKTRLGNRMIKKLKVYADGNHGHQAQQPEPLNL